jgi:hypothetical protein
MGYADSQDVPVGQDPSFSTQIGNTPQGLKVLSVNSTMS